MKRYKHIEEQTKLYDLALTDLSDPINHGFTNFSIIRYNLYFWNFLPAGFSRQ